MSKRKTAPGAADPVFAAIERHKQSRRAHLALLSGNANDEQGISRAGDLDSATANALFETAPISLDGMRAWLKYLQRPFMIDDLEHSSQTRFVIRSLLRSPVLADAETAGRTA